MFMYGKICITKHIYVIDVLIIFNMTTYRDVCKMHMGSPTQKRITLNTFLSKIVDLPLKKTLVVEYNTETRELLITDL